MILSDEASSYYSRLSISEINKINDRYTKKFNTLAQTLPRSGARILAIADLHIQRWNEIVEVRKSAFIQTYEYFGFILEEVDVNQFYAGLENASQGMLDAYCETEPEVRRSYQRIQTGSHSINASARNQLHLRLLEPEVMSKNDVWEFKKENSFESHLKSRGQDIIVRPSLTDQSHQQKTRAIRKKVKHNQSEFFFRRNVELNRGCFIQIVGSSDWWKIVDREDCTYFNETIHRKAYAVKVDEQSSEIPAISQQASAVVYGNVTALQVAGIGNTQNVSISDNSKFIEALNELLQIVKSSSINPYDKDDAIEVIERLPKLAQDKQNPDALERAEKRLSSLETILSKGGSILEIARPALKIVADWFHSS